MIKNISIGFFLFFLFPYHIYGQSEPIDPVPTIEKAGIYFEQLRYDSAEILYEKVIPLTDQNLEPALYCKLINRHAASLYWQDKVHESDSICLRNLEICHRLLGTDHPETAQALINVGAVKFIIGGRGIVADYFKEAAWILEDNYGPVHPAVAKAYEWLGTYHEGNADTIPSRKYLWKAYNIWKKTKGPEHPDLAEIYRYMGLYYKRYRFLDSALICFDKAKKMFDQKYGEANFHSVKCLNNAADVYAWVDSLEHLVEPTYRQCEELIDDFPAPNRMAVVMTLYNRAEYILNNKQQYKLSLRYMNRLLQEYFPGFEAAHFADNPDIPKDYFHWIPHLALWFKASVFRMLAKTDTLNEKKYLLMARNSFLQCDKLSDNIRLHLVNLDDILMFANKHAQIYHAKAHTNFRLFQLTGDTIYLSSALTYISKMNLAQKNQSELFYYQSLGLPKKILDRYLSIKNQINELKNQSLTEGDRQSIQRRIVQKTIEQDLFFANMMSKYKSLLQREPHEPNITVSSLKQNIRKKECLLILVENIKDSQQIPDYLTLVYIAKDSSKVVFIPGKKTFVLAKKYNEIMSQRFHSDSVAIIGKKLYATLIEPFKDLLEKEITVIPSARMSTLPFETLPVAPKNEKLLIHDYLISKVFSISDYLEVSENVGDSSQDSILAIAPLFSKTKAHEISLLARRDSSLINLPGSIEECRKISDYFSTRLIDGFAATETEFKNHCSAYPILHISTHGVPAGNKTGTVKLAFSNNGTADSEDGWLNFYEILNLNLSADLVVLSACKTGIGKMNNGIGNLNLAWAFRQAGAKSALISLWDVNDRASTRIMPAFYHYLKKGLTKPQALRQAKLDYLETADETTSLPYYWAAFDYFGPDKTVIRTRKAKHAYDFLLTGVVVMALAAVIIRKKAFIDRSS